MNEKKHSQMRGGGRTASAEIVPATSKRRGNSAADEPEHTCTLGDAHNESPPPPHEEVGHVLEWLAGLVVDRGDLASRALAACAYDALGAFVALTWDQKFLQDNMREASKAADSAVDMPSINSVVIMPYR